MQSMINTLLDPVVNFGKVTVSGGYTSTDTEIHLITGDGSKLPNPVPSGSFNLIWFNNSTYSDPADDPYVEIVRCIARVGDTLTLMRGQEGTSASAKNIPTKIYKMVLSPTKKTIDDIQIESQSNINTHSALSTSVHGVGADTIDGVGARNIAISAHAGITSNVHGFDASGGTPAQTHGISRHTGTIGDHDINLLNVGANTHAQIDTAITTSIGHIAASGTSVHGLGTMSTQASSNVSITGGSITGITDIAIADGGTGASDIATARANLGIVNPAWTVVTKTSADSPFTAGSDNIILCNAGWYEMRPAGDVGKLWASVALNSNGSVIIASSATYSSTYTQGRIYTSQDYGVTWTERRPAGDVDLNWNSVAIDDNGSNMMVCNNNSGLYISSNYGATWTSTGLQGKEIASDSDGSNLIVSRAGGISTSSDYGATWTTRFSSGAQWFGVASDSDGSVLIANATSYGNLYTSTDSGVNWTQRTPGPVTYWGRCDSDSDGSNLVVCTSSGTPKIFTSADSGVNWTEKIIPGAVAPWGWSDIASNSTGSKLIVCANSGRVYMSVNDGTDWTEQQPLGNSNGYWKSCDINGSGDHIVLAASADYWNPSPNYTNARIFGYIEGSMVINLPPAASTTNKVYIIKKMDSTTNSVVIDGYGSETIDGQLTYTITTQYKSVTIQSDGVNWIILGSLV